MISGVIRANANAITDKNTITKNRFSIRSEVGRKNDFA